MNIDKDDLFRNAIPGFVFILVILSFYIGSRMVEANTIDSILTIVAGFPIGFIIQSVHRMAIHTFFGERKKMQENEYSEFKKGRPEKNPEEFSQKVAFELNEDKNKKFRERIDFLNAYFHALGGSAVAIWVAIFLLETHLFFNSLFYRELWLRVLWVIVSFILWYGRGKIQEEYNLCRKIFIQETMISNKKSA